MPVMDTLSSFFLLCLSFLFYNNVFINAQDIVACGGFIKSDVEINFSLIEKIITKDSSCRILSDQVNYAVIIKITVIQVKLFTIQGNLKYQSLCAPNNGYYTLPIYDKGHYVLKVSAPKGWTFEPESVEVVIDGQKDKCSLNEDINFVFTGFGLVGRVVSQGQSSGPAGVTLTLKQSTSKAILKTTTSSANGDYIFDKVLPGTYIVEGSHSLWKMQPNSVTVHVARETGFAPNVITVLGFDVRGRVVSDGEPVTGVFFALFSDRVQAANILDCEKTPIKGRPKWDGKEPLCHVTSGSDGSFVFPSLPCGKYKLIPYYRGDNTVFDVIPSQIEFTVNQESIVIKDVFTVAGFSVGGRVLVASGGAGVAGAKISLDGREECTTRDDGSYHLDGMKAGTYKLEVKATKLHFDPLDVKITPNTPQLPDVFASSFEVCGEAKLDKVPEGSSSSRKIKIVDVAKSTDVAEIASDNSGAFCVYLKPSKYSLKVLVSAEEKSSGLLLLPNEREITVKDQPLSGIKFNQFLAKLSGSIKCLESCKKIPVLLSSGNDHREMQNLQAVGESNTAQFLFSNLLPGKYQVSLVHDDWCWKQKTLDVELIDKDVSDIRFEHNGYILSISTSHDVQLDYKVNTKSDVTGKAEVKPAVTGSHKLTKGVNKVCLSQAGTYELTPVSCHQFDSDKFTYDTMKPTVVTLTATKHRLDGSVTTAQKYSDIVVFARSSDDAEPVTIGPLKGEKSTELNKYVYRFSHWAKFGDILKFSASSSQLLFSPAVVNVVVDGESCREEKVLLEGRQGQFVSGSVTPALADISLIVQAESGDEATKINLHTDVNGKYSVGPLNPDVRYVVVPSQDGFVFTEIEGKPGHFRAVKLGKVVVKVTDDSQLLTGVLVSLSGGAGYRKNNLTDENGTISFNNLKPGQYFLRPMMKEFDFEPSSQIIDVVEGSMISISIKAKRIAFSCFGMITSLNGEPEPSILVEAVGKGEGDCGLLQEESKTEQDGTFRIRGLLPRCEYAIRLKSCQENAHIERTTPSMKLIQVSSHDISGLRIIAYRLTTTMDVSVNVVTSVEHLSTLKASLYRQTNLDSPIHSQPLGASFFFYLPNLQLDNQTYVLRLTTSLSRQQYHYALPELTFKANTSFKHFVLHFKASHKSAEQELTHSSLLILPVTLLFVIAAVYYDKVLPLLQQRLSQLFSLINDRLTMRNTSSSSSRTMSVNPALALADVDLDQFDSFNKTKKKIRKT